MFYLLKKVQQIVTFSPFILGFVLVGPLKGSSEEWEKMKHEFCFVFYFYLK